MSENRVSYLENELEKHRAAIRMLSDVATKPDGGIPSAVIFDYPTFIGHIVWPLLMADPEKYDPIDYTMYDSDNLLKDHSFEQKEKRDKI